MRVARLKEIKALIISSYKVDEITSPAEIAVDLVIPVKEVLHVVKVMVKGGELRVQVDDGDGSGHSADQVSKSG